jgi:Xaa-Pro aminopeptidase
MNDIFSKEFFERNRQKLKAHIDSQSVAILFSSHKMPRNGDQYFPFRQNSDLFYLSGIEQENTILVIEKEQEFLFVEQPDSGHALWEGDRLSPERAKELSGFETIKWSHEFEKTVERLLKSKSKIYFNFQGKMNRYGVRSLDEIYLEQFRNQYPLHSFFSLRPIMTELRLRKEPEEIEAIKKAIEITANALKNLYTLIRPDISEKSIEAELTREFLRNNARGFAFDPIVASGKNATILHYTENTNVCGEGELVLIDFGAEYRNYAADVTRTLPVSGRFTSRQKDCYQAVLEAMKNLENAIKPGVTIKELNRKMVEELTEKHIQLGLYKREDLEQSEEFPWKKYFPHGVSHFIGLDVHDYGDKNVILDKGMVLSWEPGIYIPEENLGIRIEDDILVDTPSINLSSGIPKEIEELEERLNENMA